MTQLTNHVSITATQDRVWAALTDVGALDRYDPTVKRSELKSKQSTGVGARRRVTMADGKHWFEETLTACQQPSSLTYELQACNFPIRALRHDYRLQVNDGQTTVTQTMDYAVKYGLLGLLVDRLMLRRQFDEGVKKFMSGLKDYAERID